LNNLKYGGHLESRFLLERLYKLLKDFLIIRKLVQLIEIIVRTHWNLILRLKRPPGMTMRYVNRLNATNGRRVTVKITEIVVYTIHRKNLTLKIYLNGRTNRIIKLYILKLILVIVICQKKEENTAPINLFKKNLLKRCWKEYAKLRTNTHVNIYYNIRPNSLKVDSLNRNL